MIVLRLIGVVIALAGLGVLLYSLVEANQSANSALPTYGLFGMLAGLLIAMAADAGQKMGQRQKGKSAKTEEKKS
jgi:threonine/homoserine efflux transporter RhtA